MKPNLRHPALWLAVTATSVATALMSGCTVPVPPTPPAPAPVLVAPPPVEIAPPETPPPPSATPTFPPLLLVSGAANARDYRRDAANHIYTKNIDRIFRGKMPPLLYAIGVLQVNVDGQGGVTGLHWMRAPRHAPEVIAEIERTVRRAAPYPVPARMGRVVYTDTWLWHKSGLFQLDTLTEGQF